VKFVSTRGTSPALSASDAILKGLAPDGGLYVPQSFPHLEVASLGSVSSFAELAYEVLHPWFEGDRLEPHLGGLCYEAFDFPVPLHWHDAKDAVLELFHGPTAAFKDFGARFLAASMERLASAQGRTVTILVATSGDTGSAVAAAFHGRKHIAVKVLYPRGRVSERQERQLTCWDGNVQAYSVEGTFDDCQRMVKQAFMDRPLAERYGLSSANSINLGRLLPQMTYAWSAALEVVLNTGSEPVMIIPSGNVGNCCASYWAMAMGAPIKQIRLALNANRTVEQYLQTGTYQPWASVATLANAMDVGDPSNMERLLNLFPDFQQFSAAVQATSVDDRQIAATIAEVYGAHRYVVCPHTATAEYVRRLKATLDPTVVYATAHPAKFDAIVEPIVKAAVPVPPPLAAMLSRPRHVLEIEADYHNLF